MSKMSKEEREFIATGKRQLPEKRHHKLGSIIVRIRKHMDGIEAAVNSLQKEFGIVFYSFPHLEELEKEMAKEARRKKAAEKKKSSM